MTPEALIVSDWGRFQNPKGGGGGGSSGGGQWEECPYKREVSRPGSTEKDPSMLIGIIDQSVANW